MVTLAMVADAKGKVVGIIKSRAKRRLKFSFAER